MPARVYECLFLLDTNKVAGDVPAAAKQIHTILERHHAEILASRPWDERRLAYPVNGHKKGLYYLTYFRAEGKNLLGIEHDVALNEMILRSLVLHVDPGDERSGDGQGSGQRRNDGQPSLPGRSAPSTPLPGRRHGSLLHRVPPRERLVADRGNVPTLCENNLKRLGSLVATTAPGPE